MIPTKEASLIPSESEEEEGMTHQLESSTNTDSLLLFPQPHPLHKRLYGLVSDLKLLMEGTVWKKNTEPLQRRLE
jgi:hypothetical protein